LINDKTVNRGGR